jgi:hypothetical protein
MGNNTLTNQLPATFEYETMWSAPVGSPERTLDGSQKSKLTEPALIELTAIV